MKGGPRSPHVLFAVGLVTLLGIPLPAAAATEIYLDGYFRLRARLLDNLALNRDVPLSSVDATDSTQVTSDGTSTYFQQRLRISPELRVNQYLSVFSQIDVLPDLFWGTDPERLSLNGDYLEPVGQSQSFTLSASTPLIVPRRAWAEFYTPIGRVKLGRAAMEVGSGVYFNDGNGIDEDYGDTADRAQFLTRIGRVWALLGFDQIYEGDPDKPYDAQAASVAIAYRSELLSGSFFTYYQMDRYRPDEGTLSTDAGAEDFPTSLDMRTWTFDLWGQARIGPVDLELETLLRYGAGDLVLQGVDTDIVQVVEDSAVLQYGGMVRANWTRKQLKFGLEGGLASGDKDDTDSRFTRFTFDRDYHVGFLLFRQPLPQRARRATDASEEDLYDPAIVGPAVSNAIYVTPAVEMQVINNLSARLSGLGAWAMESSAALNNQTDYGYEIDLELNSRLYDRLLLGARGAFFFPGAVFGEQREFAFGGELRAVIEF